MKKLKKEKLKNKKEDKNTEYKKADKAEPEKVEQSTGTSETVVKPAGKFVSGIYEIASVFISAVIIILVLFTFVWRFVGVVGDSMLPTLHSGDWLVISQYGPKLKNGDIVIVTQPNSFNENIVKRVIATAGDYIKILENGEVEINGNILQEDYVVGETLGIVDFEVPSG